MALCGANLLIALLALFAYFRLRKRPPKPGLFRYAPTAALIVAIVCGVIGIGGIILLFTLPSY